VSFDTDSPDQMVDPKKRTTKVNLGLVLGVLAFFIVGAFAMCSVERDPPQTPPDSTPIP